MSLRGPSRRRQKIATLGVALFLAPGFWFLLPYPRATAADQAPNAATPAQPRLTARAEPACVFPSYPRNYCTDSTTVQPR